MGDGIPPTKEGTVDSSQVVHFCVWRDFYVFEINMPFLAFRNEMVSCLGGVGALNVPGCHSMYKRQPYSGLVEIACVRTGQRHRRG